MKYRNAVPRFSMNQPPLRMGCLVRGLVPAVLGWWFTCPVRAAMKEAPHPFILWTKEDAAAIKRRIETERWAAERQYLLMFIGALLDGKGNSGSAGLRTANYLAALRYDVLYDSVTPEQRRAIEETFRKHVREEMPFSTPVGRFGILPNLALPRRCGVLLMTVALRDQALIRELAGQH